MINNNTISRIYILTYPVLITEKNIEVTDFNKEKWHLIKSLKKNITRKL